MLERRNPLPAGFYHIDAVDAKLRAFLDWRTLNRATVKVRKTNQEGGISWLLFEVVAPTPWEATKFGFPSVAEGGMRQERPQAFEPTKDVLDQIADKLPKPSTTVNTVAVLAVLVVGVWVYKELRK